MSKIQWQDSEGFAELSNLKPSAGSRFFDWTPDAEAIGPAEVGLGTGRIAQFPFRDDYLVSFEIRGIPKTELSLILRLETHLLDGYIVALSETESHPMYATYALCSLAPDTAPSGDFTDNICEEYTFGVKLLAVAEADVPEDEPFYPPVEMPNPWIAPPGNCAVMDSGSTHVSALSALRIRGDDFGAWSTGTAQYDAFVADAETNVNYENSIPDSNVNSLSPAEFNDYAFNWDTNAVSTRRSIISQVDWNGGHRSIKSIKTTADGFHDHHFFELIANGKTGGAKLDAVWTRQVFRYSTNYAVYDPNDCNGRGVLLVDFDETIEDLGASPAKLISCGVWNKGLYPQISPADGSDLLQCQVQWSTSGGGGSGTTTTDIGPMASQIYTGTVRELICFCGQPLVAGVPDPTKLRLAVWLGEAGAIDPVTSKIFDVTKTGVAGAHQVGQIKMFRKTDTHVLLSGDAMCYECLEWEIIDATESGAHNNPFALDP